MRIEPTTSHAPPGPEPGPDLAARRPPHAARYSPGQAVERLVERYSTRGLAPATVAGERGISGGSLATRIATLVKLGSLARALGLAASGVRRSLAAVAEAARGVGRAIATLSADTGRRTLDALGSVAALVVELPRNAIVTIGRGLQAPATLPARLVEAVANTLALVLVRPLSALQTLLHLEAPGRRLNEAELAAARAVFGDSVDLSRVRIKQGFAGLGSLNARPFTLGDTIYLKGDRTLSTLIHELVHVWQNQHGPVPISSALYAQSFGAAYDYGRGIAAGKLWQQLNPEQQAQLIEDAHIDGRISAGPLRALTPWIHDGEDYAPYLARAVEELRAGRGAGSQ